MLDSDMQGTVVQYLRQQMNFVQMGVTSSTSVVLCLNAGVIFTDLNVWTSLGFSCIRVVWWISGLFTPRSMMTSLFSMCPMVVEIGIPQFHKSICTTSVEVLWLSVKPQCDCFLYICVRCKGLAFVSLFYWPEHMLVTGRQVWTVRGMWKNFQSELLQLLVSDFYRVGHGIGIEENDSMQ